MSEAGVIHDIGYQRYEGARLGRRYSTWSIYVHSVRTAFGIGRTAKAKLLPIGLFALANLASLILVVVGSQLPEPPVSYVGLVSTFSIAITAFVAIVAPELVSRDLRNTALPLYFSRPPHRTDYALAKLGALATAAFVMYAGPLLLMVIGTSFSTKDGFGGVMDQFGDLVPGVGAAVIHSIVIAAIALPLAALTGRRVFATGLIIGVFLLTAPISSALQHFGRHGDGRYLAGLLNPVNLINGVDMWLFGQTNGLTVEVGGYGPVYGVVAVLLAALGTALVMWRYKKVNA
ncbi:ABC transporter permease [Actinocrispum wychmicini]|uniref:ABC-2 type transport system permease protein n=1 Tax=Actinocrispum wychmicini TaxID=1213861 RepID=A0A4V2S4V9_9PSEU|nr:ABC transporter permease [Actinocrispum wychmicini]TCO49800.1 ABC-2 type transport system permease protein [Actinocrispum wychmicini]